MKRTINALSVCLCVAAIGAAPARTAATETVTKKYAEILVVTGLEDTTSAFYSIYFYDKGQKLVRLIEMWNGGCCQAPYAHDYAINGTRSSYVHSFILESKAKTMVGDVICKKLSTLKLQDPPKPELDDLDALLEEALPFAGCK